MLVVPQEKLKRRTYNVTGMSFTPEELEAEVKKYLPNLKITYEPDSRQEIGKYTLVFKSLHFNPRVLGLKYQKMGYNYY